ncbi:MAG: hypothetical protein SNG97_06375 [Rikenellaceae bacterium]
MPIKAVAETVGKVADTAQNFNGDTHTTGRHEADMSSDNCLSKNIRPILMIWAMTLFTSMVILACFGIELPVQYRETMFWVMTVAVGFYFGGRSFEKWSHDKVSTQAKENRVERKQDRYERRNNK